ncbi:hypothetical protein [Pseudanabaena sp. PCC 6802]|uniref:hypothetical protein n=1 Tax=Pseudanabaena sp. PCC 6802 TaxID=118173 RepID=UPI00034B15E5|nr:hypothetical protein [Pseudanabaena sp. PCC 6802]
MSAIVKNISQHISLQKLSWLAAVPISLAAYGAVTVPAQANEYNSYEHSSIRYDKHSPDYTYCNRWEYRHDYRCADYYQSRYEERYNRYDKWDYRYHDNHHYKKHHSRWD